MSKTQALLAFLAFIVTFAAFDTYLALDEKPANTVSAGLRWLGKVWPLFRILFCVASGAILGHLYW